MTSKEAIKRTYTDYISAASERVKELKKAREDFNRIEYRTKPGGGVYAKTEDNFAYQGTPLRFRKDRRYKWIELHTQNNPYGGSVYSFDAREDLQTVKAEIETVKARIEQEIKEAETAASLTFTDFLKGV